MATSMIKVKQRGSRRKQPEEDSMEFNFEVPSGFEFSKPPPPPATTQRSNHNAPPPPPPPVAVMARLPTANEAALSAKNYRLAKELSDLRVRHREECKKTSRLTMENMSLASRCREAISHVAMLQRELELYQQRDAESLALQRQQTQRFASTLSDPQQFDADDSRDALPVPPKKFVSPMPPSSIQKQVIEKTITARTPPESRLSSSTSSSAMEMASDDDTLEKSRDESFQSSLVSPASSPDTSTNDSSSYVFTPSPNSQYSTPSKRDTPLHMSPKRSDASLNSPMQHRLPQSTTSPMRIIPVSPSRGHRRTTSLDAFEASFAATFPSNFHSPREEEEQSQSSTKADVYDPFSAFASPSPMAAVVRHAQVDTSPDLEEGQLPKPTNPDSSEEPTIAPIVSWDDDEVSSSSSFSTPPRRRPEDVSNENEPPKTPAKTPSVEARAKYENAMAPAVRQNTPPLRLRVGDESIEIETPKTPSKTPSAEARSKYDFALQPTRANTPSSIESGLVQGKHHGPSPLLQRIQQKRKQKKLNRQQSEPSSTLPKPDFRRYSSAPESRTVAEGTTPIVAPENRDAGSLIGVEEEPTSSIASRSSRRRSVKQPLSYAEPALNTKVRKGHVFFQKDIADVKQ